MRGSPFFSIGEIEAQRDAAGFKNSPYQLRALTRGRRRNAGIRGWRRGRRRVGLAVVLPELVVPKRGAARPRKISLPATVRPECRFVVGAGLRDMRTRRMLR